MTQRFKHFYKALFLAFFVVCFISPLIASAAQVSLQWYPNGSPPDGYNLYKRLQDQAYDYTKPVNGALIEGTSYAINGLIEGKTYYFVIRSVLDQTESGDSNEASYQVPISKPDADGDGHLDSVDAFPEDPTEWLDTDADGVGNNKDSDDDGDGLPDEWEHKHGMDPLNGKDAGKDMDGDGVSNLDEFEKSTDPTLSPGNTPPDQPLLMYPVDGAVDVQLMPTLMTDAFVDADGHSHSRTLYQIATSEDWSTDLVYEYEFTTQLTQVVVGDLILDPDTTYYWRVRFYDEHNGRSDWSATSQFTTTDSLTAGFFDDDGDGILDHQEVLEKDVDPSLGNSSEMFVVDTSDEVNPQIGVVLSGDVDMISFRAAEPDSVEVGNADNRPEVLTGLVSFKVGLLNGATSADITVSLLEPAPAGAVWYKYHIEKGWIPYPNVTFSDDRLSVTLHLVDGGMGDDDGVENGIIVDPSGLGYVRADESAYLVDTDSPATSGSSSSGGGCFIRSSEDDDFSTPLMVTILLGTISICLAVSLRAGRR